MKPFTNILCIDVKRINHLLTMSYIVSLISTGPYTIQMHIYIYFYTHSQTKKARFFCLFKNTYTYSTYEGALGGTVTHTYTHTSHVISSFQKKTSIVIHCCFFMKLMCYVFLSNILKLLLVGYS